MGWRRVTSIGTFVADRDGSDFRKSYLTGWDDGPPVRSGISEKAQQDGGWDATGWASPRVITVDGFVEQASRSAALQVIDELQALQLRALYQFAVDDPDQGLRRCTVRVTGKPAIEWVGPVSFRYSAQVTAPDPTKFGGEVFSSTSLAATGGGTGLVYPLAYPLDYGVAPGVTPGSIAAPNAGTTSYHPRLRIDGPVPNPVVTMLETGASLRYGGTVAAGQWLDIDLANRRVLLNGLVSHRHLVTFTGDWLSVPVGGGSLTWTADAADPSASLSVWAYEGAWS